MSEPLEAKLYLSRHCPHCQEVLKNFDKVRENFAQAGYIPKIIFYEDEPELFLIHGVEAVPTLMLPFQRPWGGVAPIWLIELDRFRRMVEGSVSIETIQHEAVKARAKEGITHNEKWDVALKHVGSQT